MIMYLTLLLLHNISMESCLIIGVDLLVNSFWDALLYKYYALVMVVPELFHLLEYLVAMCHSCQNLYWNRYFL